MSCPLSFSFSTLCFRVAAYRASCLTLSGVIHENATVLLQNKADEKKAAEKSHQLCAKGPVRSTVGNLGIAGFGMGTRVRGTASTTWCYQDTQWKGYTRLIVLVASAHPSFVTGRTGAYSRLWLKRAEGDRY